jgi:hypothetical protein
MWQQFGREDTAETPAALTDRYGRRMRHMSVLIRPKDKWLTQTQYTLANPE